MKKTQEIQIISVDLFRTLAIVDDNSKYVWKTILGRNYSDRLRGVCQSFLTKVLLAKLDEAAATLEPFKTIREIFVESFDVCLKKHELDFKADEAAEVLICSQRLEHFFEDARSFLEAAAKHYRVCLSTDCDTGMLAGIEKLFRFEKIFVSEQLRAYKGHPQFFKSVLDYYGLEPHNIFHIGDSKQDILTPGRMGLQTCWICRDDGLQWQYQHICIPDFQVKSLSEILKILGI